MNEQINSQLFLVINAGSSSLKFQLFGKTGQPTSYKYESFCHGLFEQIGHPHHSRFVFGGSRLPNGSDNIKINHHGQAVNHLLTFLKRKKLVTDFNQLVGIGHRVVNCGPDLTRSCLITPTVIAEMERNIAFAPLHNRPTLNTIKAFAGYSNVPAVAIFDVSFHQTIPMVNYLYPVPYRWYVKYAVRRYGMHGTNYRYVVQVLTNLLKKPVRKINAIICHLGNGASVCGVKNGQSVITSMGITPLEGLMMGTRSGDVDPAIGQYLATKINLDLNQFIDALNFSSGLLAVSGVSGDMRTIKLRSEQGDKRCRLAIEMFVNRVVKYISWYQNEVGLPLDCVVFTGGIGENAPWIRQAIADKIITLQLNLDHIANQRANQTASLISVVDDATTPVYVIKANEELIMCQDIDRICQKTPQHEQ